MKDSLPYMICDRAMLFRMIGSIPHGVLPIDHIIFGGKERSLDWKATRPKNTCTKGLGNGIFNLYLPTLEDRP